ncbi:MAG: SRPBCC domain-containing protein [Ignavibacteriae bacterium]|nr:SRPBCC domain-containing protein [Ignavibacteriota bacterium]
MEKLKFNIHINASKEKVWKTLWDNETYKKWSSVFSEGSSMESDWKINGRTLFVDGKGNGMISTIAELRENEFLSFKHLGFIKDGIEDYESEEIKKWSGIFENYTLKPNGNTTELIIEMDMNDEYKDFFLKTWPDALNKIKELSE